jgi:uncharacterized protein YjbJ (UPF0337 family)
MVNQQTLRGNWNEIAGKIRTKWGQLTDNELQKFKGNSSQLVGLIQRKTGETRHDIEEFLDDLTTEGGDTVSRVLEAVSEYAADAMDTAKRGAHKVADQMREGYESAEHTVQERPGQSMALAFGAGLVVGIVAAILVRSE